MKKIFSFVIAALAAVSMYANEYEQIPMTVEQWGWSYNCTVTAVEGGLQAVTKDAYGAMSTGWGEGKDLTGWDKIVVVVESMEGCEGDWWKLQAWLNDTTDNVKMYGDLGKEAVDNERNYLVLDLHQAAEGFDITVAKQLAIQCQPIGGKFVVSQVYLEKEEATAIDNVSVRNNGIRYNLLGQEVDENYKGVVILNGQKMIVR